MEGPLSFLQIDAGSMIILGLILTLLDYLVNGWSYSSKDIKENELKVQLPKRIHLNYWSKPTKETEEEEFVVLFPSYWSNPTKEIEEEEVTVQQPIRNNEETPILTRHLESRYREKLLNGVRRRLDKQF